MLLSLVISSILSSPHLSAGRAEAVLVCADAVPTEAADLIAASAGEEVDVINLQRLHAQRALHGVVLHFRAVGHPMAWRGVRVSQLVTDHKAMKMQRGNA